MPLPEAGDIKWPPVAWQEQARWWMEWDAWYAGDPSRLQSVYGQMEYQPGTQTRRGSWWRRWWNKTNITTGRESYNTRAQLHVPLPGDIAQTSAALLFGEHPRVTIPEAHLIKADQAAKDAEDYLHRMMVDGDVFSRLLEGAETAAAMGGAILKPSWDLDVSPVPLMSIIQADMALPSFRYGELSSCTLWREVARSSTREVIRHLEVHETGSDGRGVILHGLYRGTSSLLGRKMELTDHPDTQGLTDAVLLPFEGLGVEYVPNMRPNRRRRGSSVGQSDYAGAEGIFDALDETYASWMRDVRLAKGRLMVPQEYLDRLGSFDADQEVFVPLDVDPAARAGAGGGITAQQFGIRTADHENTILHLIERAVSSAGYSPQTFGLHIEGRAESGTALKIREQKTLTTQQRKAQWWGVAVESALFKMLAVAQATLGESIVALRPQVEMADSLPENPMELAQTVSLLDQARAVSVETKVRMVHPDWDEEQIGPEVKRVLAEQGLVVPDVEDIGLPPLTPALTGQIGELYRAGFTADSIVAALSSGDMTKLEQREGVQPVTLSSVEEEPPAGEELPPPAVIGAGTFTG
jgi:A118 family predicted phage portal protein